MLYKYSILNKNIILQTYTNNTYHNTHQNNSPAFCNTTCASIDLLMFDEHTVPNDNFDGCLFASGGGIPGGVDARCRP